MIVKSIRMFVVPSARFWPKAKGSEEKATKRNMTKMAETAQMAMQQAAAAKARR